MRAWQIVTLALCLFVPTQIGLALAQDASTLRLALVIGNAKYGDSDAQLPAASADAAAVAAELGRQGFSVDLVENATQADLVARSERLLGAIAGGATVVVYFNGFAIQSGRQNYLIPVDVNIWTETDVQRAGLGIGQLLGEIERRGAADTYLIVEGANRNQYERRFRNYSIGLASVATLPAGSTLMLSAAPGAVLSPSAKPRGLLSAELVRQLAAARGISLNVLDKTRTAVMSASNGSQTPWILSVPREPPAPPAKTAMLPEAGAKPAEPPAMAPPPVPAAPPQESGPAGEAGKDAGPPPPKPEAGIAAESPKAPAEPPPAPPPSAPPPPATPAAAEPPAPAEPPVPPAAPVPVAAAPATEAPSKKVRIAQIDYSPADEGQLKDLDAAIARNPKDAASLYTRGQLYALHYDFVRALADFDRVLQIDPKDVEALNNRCWIKAIIDDLDSAILDCNAALKLRPEFLDALDSRGFVMLKINLPRRAISDYEAALKINSKHASALYGRGIAYRRLGEKGHGDRDVKLALAIDPQIGEQFSLFGVNP